VARVDLLLANAGQLLTLSGPAPRRGPAMADLGIVRGGALAVHEGRIVAAGREAEVRARYQAEAELDAGGRVVMPAFVDPHTHVIYAGDRIDEFELRLKGATYQEIMAAGGGIMSTVRATRSATDDELFAQSLARLARMAAQGTATVEVKSGYGLEVETELRMLRLLPALAEASGLRLVPTFLGAHALPAEYAGRADAYVDLVLEEMLPRVVGLAEYCDVFCDEGAFTLEQTARILRRAKALGLGVRVHADEFAALGATALAAELGAASADHLMATPEAERACLARSATAAVLLPATSFGLASGRYADGRAWVDAGAIVALASDCNPGTAPGESMPFTIALACRMMGLLPAEAVVAATLNAAYAVGRADVTGSLVPGKAADIVILDADDYRELAYRFGGGLAYRVIIGGRVRGAEAPTTNSPLGLSSALERLDPDGGPGGAGR
jgi:imidazolonepropionase